MNDSLDLANSGGTESWTEIANIPLFTIAGAIMVTAYAGTRLTALLQVPAAIYALVEWRRLYAYRQSPVAAEQHRQVLRQWVDAVGITALPLLFSSNVMCLRYAVFVLALIAFSLFNAIVPIERGSRRS